MACHISGVTISGLWGKQGEINVPISEKINFIIGKNGTGKTTVINLLAAILSADFERLDKIVFAKVIVHLQFPSSRKRPSIEVTKTQKPKLPYSDIQYKIKLSSSEIHTFDLDAYAEERAYRGAPQRFYRERAQHNLNLFVQTQLEKLVDVTWLSVNRQSDDRERPEEKRYRSAVDQKLATLTVELIKYFNKLNRNFSEKTNDFQRTSFLSLTTVEKTADIRTFLKKVDADSERSALSSIFRLLGVAEDNFNTQLNENFNRFEGAKKKFLASSGMSLEEFFVIFNSFRTHALVEHYEKLQKESEKIFRPRNVFLDVLNGLLSPRKSVELLETGEIQVIPKIAGAPLALEELSSGEKQLFIILGQAVLQESKTSIYIADEPELSLHVEWQELLTQSIEQLNPNAQIIFATHSPDIVGQYSNRVIDMEEILP